MSFAGAAKQKRAARDAERAAAMAMAEVEKELTKNEMDALSINKEAYEIMEDQVDAQVATQMAANREGDQRGAIAGANRVQAMLICVMIYWRISQICSDESAF